MSWLQVIGILFSVESELEPGPFVQTFCHITEFRNTNWDWINGISVTQPSPDVRIEYVCENFQLQSRVWECVPSMRVRAEYDSASGIKAYKILKIPFRKLRTSPAVWKFSHRPKLRIVGLCVASSAGWTNFSSTDESGSLWRIRSRSTTF